MGNASTTVMKKQNRVYSTSDFSNAVVNIVLDDCYWTVDAVQATKAGEISNLPLFKLQLRKLEKSEELEGGAYVDASSEMTTCRTYFCRDGRPMYNSLADAWKQLGDKELFAECAPDLFMGKNANGELVPKVYSGHVVRLSGVEYEKEGRDHKTVVRKNSLELWYPRGTEPGLIISDFTHLCNKGTYRPILQDPAEKQDDPLAGFDPAVVAAVMAALGKK